MKSVPPGFYTEMAWQKCKKSYMESQNRICERCGKPAYHVHHRIYLTLENYRNPEIAYGFDNLEALCHACHNKEHETKYKTEYLYKFTKNGELVEHLKQNEMT